MTNHPPRSPMAPAHPHLREENGMDTTPEPTPAVFSAIGWLFVGACVLIGCAFLVGLVGHAAWEAGHWGWGLIG